MPKSITHYYQESGVSISWHILLLFVFVISKLTTCIFGFLQRAGRDGDQADCILYYSYKDKQVLEGMIRKSATNPRGQSTLRKIDQLYACLRYCEDDFRCRRTMQLEFFGEAFDRSKCRGTCDNCREGREIDRRDLTGAAQSLLKLLASVKSQKKNGMGVTLLQLTELFRGSKSKATTKFLNVSRLVCYNDAARFKLKKKQDIDRVAHKMIFERIIEERSEQNKQGFSSDYVEAGDNALAIQNGRRQFFAEFPKPQSAAKETSATASKKRKKSPAPKKKKSGTRDKSGGAAKRDSGAAKNHEIVSIDDDSDEDEDSMVAVESDGVLPAPMAMKLERRIKKVVAMWAEEEQMMGNHVFCKCHFCLFSSGIII